MTKDMSAIAPWASFREVIDEIVRPPLENVQAKVAADATRIAEAVKRLDTEVRDANTAVDTRLAALNEVIRQQTTVNQQHFADAARTTTKLWDNLTAAVETLTEVTENLVRKQADADQAATLLAAKLRRQTWVLIAGAVILLLAVAALIVVR